MPVRVYTPRTDDAIERLECLSREERCGPKLAYVCREMEDNMKFRFVKPLSRPQRRAREEVVDGIFEVAL